MTAAHLARQPNINTQQLPIGMPLAPEAKIRPYEIGARNRKEKSGQTLC